MTKHLRFLERARASAAVKWLVSMARSVELSTRSENMKTTCVAFIKFRILKTTATVTTAKKVTAGLVLVKRGMSSKHVV